MLKKWGLDRSHVTKDRNQWRVLLDTATKRVVEEWVDAKRCRLPTFGMF
jgi:hypothetical protein